MYGAIIDKYCTSRLHNQMLFDCNFRKEILQLSSSWLVATSSVGCIVLLSPIKEGPLLLETHHFLTTRVGLSRSCTVVLNPGTISYEFE